MASTWAAMGCGQLPQTMDSFPASHLLSKVSRYINVAPGLARDLPETCRQVIQKMVTQLTDTRTLASLTNLRQQSFRPAKTVSSGLICLFQFKGKRKESITQALAQECAAWRHYHASVLWEAEAVWLIIALFAAPLIQATEPTRHVIRYASRNALQHCCRPWPPHVCQGPVM